MARLVSEKILPQEQQFVDAYIETMSVKKASTLAGYSQPNYGYRLMERPRVQKYLQEKMASQGMGADEVLARFAMIARTSIFDFVSIKNDRLVIRTEDIEKARNAFAIKKVKQTRYGIELEAYDVLDALTKLGKYHALFTNRLKTETWRDDIVELLRTEMVSKEEVIELWPPLADEFFAAAGLKV